ncbi:hypothetical protein CERSUDRAFT_86871 [Gelatoporia subvermispora B]|uniref:Translocon-associated protein subunit alpha n=1 Tax=Ceriporiopsis subvermispora (strain B) TaxID=914234 RepID=M2QAW6_CERS8|nr:hypothetical protein CERSUDRAFT_86871 [Gelatoporia subvermispora B]
MRLFGFILGAVAFSQLALASEEVDTTEPVVLAVAAFPEDNAFGHVVNGERNRIFLTIENQSDRNVTLKNIAGSFHHPETNALVKNTGDLRLNIWLEHTADDKTYRVTAYDSVVTIVEPEVSWFDLKMWSTYLIVGALLSGLGYYAYLTFVPQPKQRKRRVPQVSEPIGTVTATGAGGYQEEWIPEHHLKKSKTRKSKSGAATSGEETSGTELSGTEGRRRKGRK